MDDTAGFTSQASPCDGPSFKAKTSDSVWRECSLKEPHSPPSSIKKSSENSIEELTRDCMSVST